MEFTAYDQQFKVAYGDTVKDALDIVQDSTGRRGRFRRVSDGVDLRTGYAFVNTERYQFIPTQNTKTRLKKMEVSGGDFSDEEQGQILDFLRTTLMVQPWRSFI
eukprot:gene11673-13089_t